MVTLITPYRVLVVDDRPEMRDVMRSTVESLGSCVSVIAVPSGEEALLEIQLEPFDLLVADVLLPGINGMELMNKAKKHKPDLKVILVTGVLDRQLRQAAAGAGADAFFLKPMEPGDFLSSIKECLGLEGPDAVEPNQTGDQPSEESVSERMERLHQELGGIASVITDKQGRIQMQIGELPDPAIDTGLFLQLTESLSAARKVVKFTGSNVPKDLSYFSGPKCDIFTAHIFDQSALIAFVHPINDGNGLGLSVAKIYRGVKDLNDILLKIDNKGNPWELTDPVIENNDENDVEVDATEVEALFDGSDHKLPGTDELNAFWDSVTQGDTNGGLENSDGLTYDQALKLGIAPKDDTD